MRFKDHGTSVQIWLSARDTYDWAHKVGAAWPCSTLANKRIFAAFDTNSLCDVTVNGNQGLNMMDGAEFNAITSDFLATKLDKDHPCYFITVGQFKESS